MDELIRIYEAELKHLLAQTSFHDIPTSVKAHEAFEDAHLARLAGQHIHEVEFEVAYKAHLDAQAAGPISFYWMPQPT